MMAKILEDSEPELEFRINLVRFDGVVIQELELSSG